MSILTLVSVVVTAAALFGWLSVRFLRLPITIGTMLLTVIASLILIALTGVFPGLNSWAVNFVGQIQYENLILHGLLALLLFAGAFLLDFDYLSREKLAVTILSVPGTLLTTAAMAVVFRSGSS